MTRAIPHLLKAMEDSELLVVSSAAYSLALLGSEASSGLRELLDHPNELTRNYARRALNKIVADSD